jgi:hypothetical protein
MSDRNDTSPENRRHYLAGLNSMGLFERRSGLTLNERITAAEELRDACQGDLDESVAQLHIARSNAPGADLAHGRALSIADRGAYAEFLRATNQWEAAHKAWEAANASVSRLLAQWDDGNSPLPAGISNPDW